MRPTINVLDEDLAGRIVDEARAVLARIGIEVRGERLRQRLLAQGLTLDATGTRVLFAPDVVDEALAWAPASVELHDRAGRPFASVGGDRVHFVPGSSGLHVQDHRTGITRDATTADFVDYVRLATGLPHLAYLATAFSTSDVEPRVADAWRLYLALTHSLKPLVSGAFTEHGVPRMAEMMALFRRDRSDLAARPMAIFTVTATGNLRYGEDSCQNLLDCAEWGIPVEVVPVTIMGLIAPVSLVGAAVFHTVDVLAGIVMAQVIRPGLPVLFGGAPAAFHMREATAPMLAVEALRLDVAYAAIGKRLGLPTQTYMAMSDGKALDAQAGAETFGSALLAALAGINSVSGPGMLNYSRVVSLAKLVFDDDACGQALHFVRAMQPLDDLPTLDLVRALLVEGNLLTADHTLEHWTEEFYLPSPVVDRTSREAGPQALWQRASAEVDARLAAYQPVETDPAADREMRRLIRAGMTGGVALPATPPV